MEIVTHAASFGVQRSPQKKPLRHGNHNIGTAVLLVHHNHVFFFSLLTEHRWLTRVLQVDENKIARLKIEGV